MTTALLPELAAEGQASVDVVVEGLVKSYPGRPPVPALRGVELTAPGRRLTAVLGPSGCGKTTLLRMVAGFDRPDAGTVRVGGAVVSSTAEMVPPERRRVGIVPQEGALFPHLDVAANIGFGLRRLPRSQARARVGEMLDLVGLAGHEKRRPDELSGGQQQRVALARALAPRPAVVLLDEPFAALDTDLRASLRAEVAGMLARTGVTGILVTHDRDEALTVPDVVAVMRDGVIAQVDAPDVLYRQPVDLNVARFLGDVVVLPGEVRAGRVECALGALPHVGRHHHGSVLVMLRPEQLRLVPTGDTEPPLRAQVLSAEYHGHDALVELGLGDQRLVSRCSSTVLPAAGDVVGLEVLGPAVTFEVGRTTSSS